MKDNKFRIFGRIIPAWAYYVSYEVVSHEKSVSAQTIDSRYQSICGPYLRKVIIQVSKIITATRPSGKF